jgi:hypothetical protein
MSASSSASTSFTSASIEAPPQSLTHTTWSAPETHMVDPMDASFGYTLSSSRTHESRHDAARRQSLSADVPPPYDEEAAIPLPGYTLHAPEPLTLAMYLFKFGFRASSPSPRAHPTFTHLVSFHCSVPPILDLRRVYPALAAARAACHGGCCGARVDAGEDRGGAPGDHRDAPRGGGQVGAAMRMRARHLHAARCRGRTRCLGHPKTLDAVHKPRQPLAHSQPENNLPCTCVPIPYPKFPNDICICTPFDSQTDSADTTVI